MAEIDALSQLLQASFRGVPFPTVSLEVEFTQDGAEHKIFGKDVDNIENTGRSSRIFTASIPFLNGVEPGRNESGLQGKVLYPDLYRQFKDAFKDRTTGVLIHPDEGFTFVKPRRFRSKLDPNTRNGMFVDVVWIETDDGPDGSSPNLDTPAPLTGLESDAADLDILIGAMVPPPPVLNGDPPFGSFSDFARSIRALVDTAVLLDQRVGGAIDNMASELDRLKDSIDRLNDVRLWPVVNAIEHMGAALFDLEHVFSEQVLLKFYTVKFDTTLAGLAATLHVSPTNLMRMNPLLLEEPIVSAGELVVYS